MEIRNLIGIEIMEQGKLLKVTDAMLEGDNIVLITETVEKAKKDIKETKKGSDLNGQIWKNIWLLANGRRRIF